MGLTGKKILVTGAASGIGAETAAELMRRGATVTGADREPIAAASQTMHVDLRHRESIDDLVSDVPAGLDGLANIAGLPPTAPSGDVIKVNLRGLQRLTTGLVPKLADGASVVNLVSSAGNRWAEHVDQIRAFEDVGWGGIEEFASEHGMDEEGRSYFFSKEALLVWTMQNRWTWINRGIRMNAVSPGPIETPILPHFMESLGPRAERSINATERLGQPSDVAPAVVFLLSDESAWFRGANLTPDGGLSAHMLLSETGLD